MKERSEVSADKKGNEVEKIFYLNLTFSDKGVSEFNGKTCAVFIPRNEIVKIEVKVGSRAENPKVQLLAGLILSGLGLWGGFMVVSVGLAFVRWEAGFLVFGGIGAWMVIEALRSGHYLLVSCLEETRKLVFHGNVQEPDLRVFINQAAEMGYPCSGLSGDRVGDA